MFIRQDAVGHECVAIVNEKTGRKELPVGDYNQLILYCFCLQIDQKLVFC